MRAMPDPRAAWLGRPCADPLHLAPDVRQTLDGPCRLARRAPSVTSRLVPSGPLPRIGIDRVSCIHEHQTQAAHRHPDLPAPSARRAAATSTRPPMSGALSRKASTTSSPPAPGASARACCWTRSRSCSRAARSSSGGSPSTTGGTGRFVVRRCDSTSARRHTTSRALRPGRPRRSSTPSKGATGWKPATTRRRPASGTWFRAFFAGIPYPWHTRNDIARYEGCYASVFCSHFAAAGLDVRLEETIGHGRLDMAVPYNGHACLFEFKMAGKAMAQLKERHRRELGRGAGPQGTGPDRLHARGGSVGNDRGHRW